MEQQGKEHKSENLNLKRDMVRQTEDNPFALKRVILVSIAAFLTVCCCILFFFFVYRYHGFANYWDNLIYIFQPIIIGFVLAYLLNPVMRWCEHYALKFLAGKVKTEHKKKKMARAIGIVGALLFLVIVIILLLAAIVPAVVQSIANISVTLPDEINAFIDWINKVAKGNEQIATMVENVVTKVGEYFENWVTDIILPAAQTYITSITSGVITMIKSIINVLVGVIISVYVMSSQEKFAGQAKRIVYALFKPVRANAIVHVTRKTHKIFGGFITGKLLDSAIIGVIAYIVLAIMKMPDTVLIAVIIGVTNVVPFFGPFIGAIPSFIIIVLQNPIQGLYFLIFIVVLQQIDGNIIGPKILGNSTGLSSFWVVFAILVFGGLWGFVGMLLGVPFMALIYYLVHEIVAYFLEKRGISEDEIDYEKLKFVNKDTNKPEYFSEDEK